MTSIHDCIQRAVDARGLNPVQGRAAQGQFRQLVERYRTIMPLHQAQAAAAADLKEATRRAARSRFHMVVNQLQAMRRIQAQIAAAPDPARAIRGLIEAEAHIAGGENVRFLTDAYVRSIDAGLRDAIARVSPNLLGTSRDRALLFDMIDELHGDVTGNAEAKALADAVRHQQRRMRQLANAHGADIGELADYGVPHAHSADRMLLAGFDAWAAEVEKRLAWHRIDDVTTGQPFAAAAGTIPSRAATGRFLKDVWDSVTTRGWDDRMPSLSTGGRALYNRLGDHRQLHFASGADWRAYNDLFGTSDPFTAMMGGLRGLARDVALMRVLGPNPKAGLEFAIQVAEKRAMTGSDPALARRVETNAARARADLAVVTGAASIPEHAGWASFLSGTRTTLSSIQLGSAVLSSVTDPVTSAAAALAIGMNPANVISRGVKLMTSASTRETAARMGYVAQSLAEAGAGAARHHGQHFATGLPDRLAGFTMRASFLTFLTDMRRIAWQMEFSAHLAELAGQDFAGLPAPIRRVFEMRGIGPRDWDLLRDPAARFRAPDGEDFISGDHWLEHQALVPRMEAEGLAMRLNMVLAERVELAIPSHRVAGRARLTGGTAPGTLAGELLRSSAGYKNYPFSLLFGQYQQMMALPTPMTRATYAASMVAMLTLAGALAIQLKELAKGNDPRPMTDAVFWKAALFQGGGLGIFGDFFAAEESRTGGGIGEALAGPVAGLASDILGPIASNVSAALAGRDTHAGRDAANLVRQNTPVLSSLFYVRAAFSRIVADNLQDFLDPDARVQWRRQLAQQERDYGTQPYWPRGAMLPERAPDLMNAARRRVR